MGPRIQTQPGLGRRRFSLRGEITGIVRQTKGWWIFAQTFHGVSIRLNPNQMSVVQTTIGNVGWSFGQQALPADTIEVFMPEEQLPSFPKGIQVGVTFAQAGQIEQFFEGRIPLAVVDLVRADLAQPLENEIPQN